MTHSETRGHWLREGAIGLGTGVLYGITSVAVGHPFDTVKTKMQAQTGFVQGGGMLTSFAKVLRAEGVRGLYRGCVPPLWGSGLYRSTQFAVFEALFTKWNHDHGKREIPHTDGLQYRVLGAGAVASLARALIECPIEYAKVARQTGQSWLLRDVYTGFGMQWARTTGVMVTYFVIIDNIRRNHPSVFSQPLGQFLASAGAATFGFWLVWPFEVLKNQVQAKTPIGEHGVNATISERVRYLIKAHGGIQGLYRGILPGTYRSFLANGVSMVVMAWAQRQVTALGLR
mgnify:CR=1 FL=1|jgi:solute carrier family 25 carnitine/acylcarnitine transporter 20/29